MARNSPGGSGVVRGFPPSLSGGPAADTSLWTVEYEVDFTALGTHDFTSTATKTIDSVVWTAANSAASTKFELDGSGLHLTPDHVGSWWRGTQTLPYISAPLTSMMTSINDRDTIALQLNAESVVVADNWDAWGLAIWNGTASQQDGWYRIGSFFENGWSRGGAESHADASKSFLSPDPFVQSTFFEIVISPANGIVGSQGLFSGSFPDPLTTTSYYENFFCGNPIEGPGGTGQSVGIPTWEMPMSTTTFMIYAQGASSTTTLNTISKKMRVLRRKI